ncbi:hypothetical protein [Lacticaseibacillus sp. GG6-2]
MRFTRLLMPLRLLLLGVQLLIVALARHSLGHVLPMQVGMFSGHVTASNTYVGSIFLPTVLMVLALNIISWGLQMIAHSPRMNPFVHASLWGRLLLLLSAYLALVSFGFIAYAFSLNVLGVWVIRILTIVAVIFAVLLIFAEYVKQVGKRRQ